MEPQRGSFSLTVGYAAALGSRGGRAALGSRGGRAALDTPAMVALGAVVATTFGVFRRLEILNFNIFL
jgi:hypothetical protein